MIDSYMISKLVEIIIEPKYDKHFSYERIQKLLKAMNINYTRSVDFLIMSSQFYHFLLRYANVFSSLGVDIVYSEVTEGVIHANHLGECRLTVYNMDVG